MDETSIEYAIASQAAYIYETSGYDEAQNYIESELPGYVVDSELSDNYSITIEKPDGDAILAYRGTNPTRPDDLMADAVIASGIYKTSLAHVGLPHAIEQYLPSTISRFHLAESKYAEVKAQYPSVILTGHSMGGSQAGHVARTYFEEAHLFNPGSTPNVYNMGFRESPLVTTYLVPGDIISQHSYSYTPENQIRVVEQSAKTAHSLQNFLKASGTQEIFLPSKEPEPEPFGYFDSPEPENYVNPSQYQIPKNLIIGDTIFSDPVVLKKICLEFPELCTRGN